MQRSVAHCQPLLLLVCRFQVALLRELLEEEEAQMTAASAGVAAQQQRGACSDGGSQTDGCPVRCRAYLKDAQVVGCGLVLLSPSHLILNILRRKSGGSGSSSRTGRRQAVAAAAAEVAGERSRRRLHIIKSTLIF